MARPILVGGLTLVLLFTATCAPAKETIRLGLITPLTGDVKSFGESCKNAFLMAIEDYSKPGNYQIIPVIADDRNDATEGTNAALKLIAQDKVAGIIGPLTSKIAIPVSEIADKNRVPMVSSATNPKVTVYDGRRKPYVFRSCFTDPFQGSVAANFALKELRARTAAVLYDVGNDFSKGLADFFKATFEKSKGVILACESYQKDDVDFSALITKIAVKKPEVIFLPDYYNKVSLIARQVREKGLKSPLLGGDGWDSPDLIKTGGSAIIGSYFTNHYSPERKDKVAEAFIARYKQKYGTLPDAWSALTYDATMLYLQSLDQAKRATPEEVMKVLTDIKNFKGVTGNISFDRNGNPVKSAVILRVEKDGFRYVTTVNP